MSDIGNITERHRQAVAWIVEAAERKGLALLEVTCTETGEPAVLLVAVSTDEEGKGGRMAPLARIDVDFENEFTPPEGVEATVSTPESEVDDSGVGC